MRLKIVAFEEESILDARIASTRDIYRLFYQFFGKSPLSYSSHNQNHILHIIDQIYKILYLCSKYLINKKLSLQKMMNEV